MADNTDSIMAILKAPGGGVPNGWTDVGSGLIARRVIYEDFRKLHRPNAQLVQLHMFQQDSNGANPLRTIYDGQDSYSFEHDSVLQCGRVCKHKISGNGAGTTRVDHVQFVAGGGSESETWSKDDASTPMQGVTWRDGSPSTADKNAANALTTDDVALG